MKGKDEVTCCVCMMNEPSAKIRPCGHTVTCRGCTEKLMKQGDPCPFCRKVVTGYELGKWSSSTGAAGLWPASLKNLSELASGEGFNDYFRDSFNGNEATWRRWKEVLDVLGIEGRKRESIETQVLRITNSKDLVKLRALVELCSKEFFDDQSLSVVTWRRIMEVLEAEKNGGEVNSKQDEEQILRKLEILDTCFALGKAFNEVRDFEEARRYLKRAKVGYEEQLGRDSEKALDASLLAAIITSDDERIENFRDLLKRCERAFGEENVVTLATLS
ncbi:hypothetical protein TL16_g00327 [Triparma laevis f. inornata]|uniref:RING-type domain-containing protein n=1 Tax=Triparma laevis f. inornata TaxID=1714386 RepID=A0A9W6ZEE3_9STRA|nr:hypothetical protein TL16_g00327 [Triparma laevis f. inornata]